MTTPDTARREALIAAPMAVDGFGGPFTVSDRYPRYDLYADAILSTEATALEEARARVEELTEALKLARTYGNLNYSRRLPGQNDHYCGVVDRINALLTTGARP